MTQQTPQTLDRLLTTGLAANPARIALKKGDEALSFADLDHLSDALSQRLIQVFSGQAGHRVIVIAAKEPAIVAAAVGIWKAGGIYVPTDAFDAPERLRQMLGTIEPTLVISSAERLDAYGDVLGDLPTISYEDILTPAANLDGPTQTAPAIGPGDPAIIIHTSGSTGLPKGAVLSHGSVTTYFRNHNLIMGFDEKSVGMNNGPFHFDVSVQDTFLPLFFGSRVILHNDLFLSALILSLMVREGVTHLIAVSSVLALISKSEKKLAALGDKAPHTVITGGELADVNLINLWLTHYPDLNLNYGYGPTECNSLCMSYRVQAPEPGRSEPFPVGTVFPGHRAVLIDDDGAVINQAGTVGVLCISGPQLMDGYWRKPELTQEVIRTIDGDRFYITGDRCWQDEDGLYHFASRRDTEVKIHGRRINLMEVRNALLSNPDVHYAAVGTVKVEDDTRIYGFVQVPEPAAESPQDILSVTAAHVPQYMVPRTLCVSETVPKTSTGKVAEKLIFEAAEKAIGENPKDRVAHLLFD